MVEGNATQLQADIVELWGGQGAAVLRLSGEVDMVTVQQMRDALASLVTRHLADVIIDASGITFMDSTGLHALVEGKRFLHEDGTNIVLIASPQVRRVLELIFPDPLFAARVDTMEAALAVLAEFNSTAPDAVQ